MVRRVLEASSGLGEQVIVTSRPEAERLGNLAGGARLLLDNEGLPCGGPPRAMVSAVSSLEGEGRALILPGDAAWASAARLRRLISYCSSRLASPLTSGATWPPPSSAAPWAF